MRVLVVITTIVTAIARSHYHSGGCDLFCWSTTLQRHTYDDPYPLVLKRNQVDGVNVHWLPSRETL